MYLTRERLRRKRFCVPNNQLSKKEKAERNQKNRDYLIQYRQRKKEAAQVDINNAGNQEERADTCTHGYKSAHLSALSPAVNHGNQNTMLIWMNFQKSNEPKMRVSKELKRTKKDVKRLKEKYNALQ